MVIRTALARIKPLSHPICYSLLIALSLTACESGKDNSSSSESTDAGNSNNRPSQAVAKRHASSTMVDYPDTGVDLGWGWDSELGVPKPTVCIEFGIANDKGQTKRLSVSEVSDSYEVMKSMGLSAAASVKTIGYQVSGKASFAKDTKVSGYSSNFVMRASVDNGVRYAAPISENIRASDSNENTAQQADSGSIRLTNQALKLAQRRDLNAFTNVCGDSFVSALYGGAELTGVVSIKTSSRQESEKASASFSGSGWGVDVSGKATSSALSDFKSEQMSLSFFQIGGSRDKIPASKEDFLAKLDTLSAEADDAPKFYRVALLPYTALENWPEKEIFVATAELDQLASYWGDYNTLYTELDEILQHPEHFCTLTGCPANKVLGEDDLKHYQTLQDEVQAALRKLMLEAINCTQPDPQPDEECLFNEDHYLSAYAYRIQLPLHLENQCTKQGTKTTCSMVISAVQKKDPAKQILQEHVVDPVNSRCRISPVDPTCLSNSEVNSWQARQGRHLVLMDSSAQISQLQARQTAAADSTDKLDWYEVLDHPPHAWVSATQTTDRTTAKQDLLDLLANQSVLTPPAQ